jgi:hypothetical protein
MSDGASLISATELSAKAVQIHGRDAVFWILVEPMQTTVGRFVGHTEVIHKRRSNGVLGSQSVRIGEA